MRRRLLIIFCAVLAVLVLSAAALPRWLGALRGYPLAGERLYSAGLGLRYQTLIGPIRVEHGRNLNPRAGDPGGTWQISVGAPF